MPGSALAITMERSVARKLGSRIVKIPREPRFVSLLTEYRHSETRIILLTID
jgi:hypothetical protein